MAEHVSKEQFLAILYVGVKKGTTEKDAKVREKSLWRFHNKAQLLNNFKEMWLSLGRNVNFMWQSNLIKIKLKHMSTGHDSRTVT